MPNRWQAMIWTNFGFSCWCINVSLVTRIHKSKGISHRWEDGDDLNVRESAQVCCWWWCQGSIFFLNLIVWGSPLPALTHICPLCFCRPEVTIPSRWASGGDRDRGFALHFRQNITNRFNCSQSSPLQGPAWLGTVLRNVSELGQHWFK